MSAAQQVVAPAAEPIMVLSLWQPWASLWAWGDKLIETRDWGTRYRGRIAVHASKRWTVDEMIECSRDPFRSVLEARGVEPGDLPLGAVVGVVTLIDCALMVTGIRESVPGKLSLDDPRIAPRTRERAFGNYQRGRYGWITASTRRVLDEPIPMRGSQGLRALAADIAARLVP